MADISSARREYVVTRLELFLLDSLVEDFDA